MRNTACIFLWQTRERVTDLCVIITDFFERTYACWRWNGARQKRPMSSIVLEPAVKEMLLADCRDFLRSEDWYVPITLSLAEEYEGTCGLQVR
jgi:hypothetical protein